MLTLFGKTRIVDNPCHDRFPLLHRSQYCIQRPIQQDFVIPGCVRDKMMQRLMHAPNIVRGQARRHRLHALTFSRQQQSRAVCLERTDPI
jgi:hypothetical protein